MIATGSGNGLARSLSNYSKVSKEYLADPVLYSTLSVARGSITAVNLVRCFKGIFDCIPGSLFEKKI